MSLWIRNGLVLASAHDDPRPLDILVEGSLISEVSRKINVPVATKILDASGHLVIPGFINAHAHGRENLLKGLVDNRPLEAWLLELAALSDERTPDDQYLSVALGAIEMVKHGATSTYELFTHIPVITPESIAAVLRAYSDVGLRAIVAPSVADIPYHRTIPGFTERLDRSLLSALDELFPQRDGHELLRIVAQAVTSWMTSTGAKLVRMGIAPVIPERCSDEFLAACRDLAETHALPLHTHLLETKVQAVERLRRDGCSTPTVLDRLGLLGSSTSLAHAIWVTDADIELIARRDCAVIHNPISNLKLGSGLMPMRKMMERHVHLAIGTDGCASADHQNLFEAIRVAAYLHRPFEPDYESWPRAVQVLEAVWEGGAYALGLAGKLGRIAPGYLADIVLLDLDSEALTPLNHPANQLVMCENGRSVRTVIVNGRIIFERGKMTLIDAAAIKARARETARRLSRSNVDRARIISCAERHLRAARLEALSVSIPGLP
jgi:guanine deaminase